MSPFLDAGISWAIGKVGDAATKPVAAKLRERAAIKELATLATESIEAASALTPEFAEDLCAPAFLKDVVGPMVIASVADPTSGLSGDRLAEAYLARFVEPYLRDRDIDDVLASVFRSNRVALARALASFLTTLRSKLYGSEHWRDAVRDWTAEETHRKVDDIHSHLGLRSTAAERTARLERAKESADTASQDLRDWPRFIEGIYIDRPELPRLLARIATEPDGRTLVIGEPGSGKSALFAGLTSALKDQGVSVLAIKADMLSPDVRTLNELGQELGIGGDVVELVEALAASGPTVLLIDQLDAVSSVMDRSAGRMRVLTQFANSFRDKPRWKGASTPVHVLVSSRPFEAAHDARFRSLQAEQFKLSLPEYGKVEEALKALDIDPARVPHSLRETLRRPFALKLFVGLVRRGANTQALSAAELLADWLGAVDLGNSPSRQRALELFSRLAEDMTETETLWRPLDLYEAAYLDEVARGEACGLLMRQDGRLGFCHQAWLDDFQARNFRTARDLVQFAWDRQDGLFARSTILRGLQRLRAHDVEQFSSALDDLLGGERTRRHLKHLVVDLIASQEEPLQREQGWVVKLLNSDMALARRAIQRLVGAWPAWRSSLKPYLPGVMANPNLIWSATLMLAAEGLVDTHFAAELIERFWGEPEHDIHALEVFQRAGLSGLGIDERVRLILGRQALQGFTIGQYVTELTSKGRTVEAANLLAAYFRTIPISRHDRVRVHGAEELGAADPKALAEALLPLFVSTAEEEVSPPGLRAFYPRAQRLPYDWQTDEGGESILPAFSVAMAKYAEADPEGFAIFITPYLQVEIGDIQALIAESIAAGGAPLARFGLQFLMSDSRRLHVGDAHLTDEHDVGHPVQNWSTKLLMRSLATHLSPSDLVPLRDFIEGWNPYRVEAVEALEPAERRRRLQWSEENRLELLAELPPSLLTPRRHRQVTEWLRSQPKYKPSGRRSRMMASWVGSPMSDAQMELAADEHIVRMLDELPDGAESPFNWRRRCSGGVVEVSRALAAFAKKNPERALAIVRDRLRPRVHETACGQVIRDLGGEAAVEPDRLLDLIRYLHAKGFASEDWRRDMAWALDAIASRRGGLPDADIALLESWIVDDPAIIADRLSSRLAFEERNRDLNKGRAKEEHGAQGVLFGRGVGGLTILPQGNYTILSAIASGLLNREEAAYQAWLEVLERHLDRPEDPHIWTALLGHYARFVYWADRDRARALFQGLWERHASAFFALSVVGRLWSHRALLTQEVRHAVLDAWANSADPQLAQAAGEFVMAAAIVDAQDDQIAALSDRMLKGEYGAQPRLGCLFAAAAAWREDGHIRESAHHVLMAYARQADGAEAHAISEAVDRSRTLAADAMTEELLWAVAENRALLRACLNNMFADALQDLLTHPGFEEVVLRLAELSGEEALQRERGAFVDDDFVSIAIALQRQSGAMRTRAMDLYERLLDGEVYGAAEAARAALRH